MLNEDNLIDLFVKTWRNLDAEIIIPYLAPDFQYSSCWVYSSLDCKGYTDYIRGKFEAIRKANSQIVVEKGHNEIGSSPDTRWGEDIPDHRSRIRKNQKGRYDAFLSYATDEKNLTCCNLLSSTIASPVPHHRLLNTQRP